ncbi:hypothetical protein IQ215_10880 [Cyanobacterium stanieri LEGE 03274]|uniref:O-antigen polymerase n=1 Tax=Cyanobacterium stanieri LEGE 03274 TaxID=1828756 RepID=A0ABR9V5M9_9CHRO|nr:hypothetical protein [Cyanobacterium stanieri]MBE9223200.1 hypothetical protein [Cyanobacterium stanieri LEGE 03274]
MKKYLPFVILGLSAIAFPLLLYVLSGIKGLMAGILLVATGAYLYKYPQTSLSLLLIYLCFGGTITYLIPNTYTIDGAYIRFTSQYAILQVIIDVFYLPALIAIILSYKKEDYQENYQKYRAIIWATIAFCLVTLLHFLFINVPNHLQGEQGNPILVGIIGLKIWLGYIPLILCGYYLIKSKIHLRKIIQLQIILIIICCLLTLFQYYALTAGLCIGSVDLPAPTFNRTSLQARCLIGGALLYYPDWNLIRLPGTFVAPWQWGWFLISSIFFATVATIILEEKVWNYLSWFTCFLLIIVSIISGQRIALLLVPLFLIILQLIIENKRKKILTKIGIITSIIILSLNLGFVQSAINNFMGRWRVSPPTNFFIDTFATVLENQNSIFGNGVGVTLSASRRFGSIKLIEIFPAQLLYETGFLGLISFYTFVTIIVIFTYRAYEKIEEKNIKKAALCLWIFILFISYNPYYYPLVVDPVNIYYWLTIGILLKLPSIEKSSELAMIVDEDPS